MKSEHEINSMLSHLEKEFEKEFLLTYESERMKGLSVESRRLCGQRMSRIGGKALALRWVLNDDKEIQD